MSIYLDTDDDGLFKKRVTLTCPYCLSRFEKYKLDMKVLKGFDELANHHRNCSTTDDGQCGLCNEFTSLLYCKDYPFKCRLCCKVFSHPLHLQQHKVCHEGEE